MINQPSNKEVTLNYPEKLFEYLATLCPEHKSAWDCATGNGQSAIGLNKYFQHNVLND